jgi:hypothetical protein
MLNFVNWRSVNATYCTLCWLAVLGLALFIFVRITPQASCSRHCVAPRVEMARPGPAPCYSHAGVRAGASRRHLLSGAQLQVHCA